MSDLNLDFLLSKTKKKFMYVSQHFSFKWTAYNMAKSRRMKRRTYSLLSSVKQIPQRWVHDEALNLLCFSEPEEPLIWMRHNSGISQTGDEMQSCKITTLVWKMRHKANCPHMLLSISQKDFSWSFTVIIIKGVYMSWPGININLEGRNGGQTQTKRYPGNRDRWEIDETWLLAGEAANAFNWATLGYWAWCSHCKHKENCLGSCVAYTQCGCLCCCITDYLQQLFNVVWEIQYMYHCFITVFQSSSRYEEKHSLDQMHSFIC